MKNILLSLAVSSILLLLLAGCEDNSLNNPVSNELTNKAGLPSDNTSRGSIILEYKLADPVRMNNYFLLSGKINYSQELIIKGPQAIAAGYDVNLAISVDAILKDILSNLEPNIWKINSESQDRFYLNANGSYVFVKSYPIDGIPNGIELVCTFAVSTQGLKLESVVLNSPVV